MLGWLLEGVIATLYNMLHLLGLVQARQTLQEGTPVMVKCVNGKTVPMFLRPGWTIADVKTYLAPELEIKQEEIRIIFAGKELRDHVPVDSCDLGNQSILHAVKIVRKVEPTIGDIESEASDRDDISQSPEVSAGQEGTTPSREMTSSPEAVPRSDAPLCESLLDLQLIGDERRAAEEEKIRKKANFYIWCNSPCNSLQAGKLRVKCSQCGEGAIVLYNDPCDWNDVLLPNRVSGCCETAGCESPVPAEFYFKCAGHSSAGDDVVPPLYLIKNNIRDIPCLACTEVNNPVLVFECPSRHVICVDCFGDYSRSRLNERQFVLDLDLGYTLPCPVNCENSLVKETRHFKLMGDNNYDRYQRFGAEELVLQTGGVLCPQPGCGAGIFPADEGANCRRLACIECSYVFCRDCLQGAHMGACIPADGAGQGSPGEGGCRALDPADPRAARAQWAGADPSSVTIRVISKPCPSCRTPTERDGGCMHMICTKPGCGLQWCWVCQVEWTRECMANHWFG